MSDLLSGPKFNRNHQTYVPGAKAFLQRLKDSDDVKKIMLGEISRCNPGARNFKVRSIDGNMVEVSFRDVSAVQIIRFVFVDGSDVSNYTRELIDPFERKK